MQAHLGKFFKKINPTHKRVGFASDVEVLGN